jgi:hypothetical protein
MPDELPRARIVEELRLDADIEDFSLVSRVLVGPSGELLIPLPQDGQVRFYDAQGRRTAEVGRKGSGPGEFQLLGSIGWLADTTWVHDPRNNERITLLSSEGAVLLTRSVPEPLVLNSQVGTPELSARSFSPSALLPDGRMVGIVLRHPQGRRE